MIAVGIAATAVATAATWVGAPFVSMNRQGTLVQQQRAAMRAAAPALTPVVIPAPRRLPEPARVPAAA